MIDSRQEVESHLYRRVVGKHTWYVPANEYAAEGIHLAAGDGYGGQVLRFSLIDGGVDHVKGPWRMRNADPLLADTGVDVRHTYWTRISISNAQGFTYSETCLMPGGHDRYLQVLRDLWAQHSELRNLHCYVDSRISTRAGWVTRQHRGLELIRTHVRYIREELAA